MTAARIPRKQGRVAADFEIHVDAGARSIVTRTRDVSEGGLFFFASSPPMVGDSLRLRLLLPERALSLVGVARYRLPEIGTGVELAQSDDYDEFREVVAQLMRSSGAWHAINGFVSALDADKTPVPSIVDDLELIEIGNTCEALRIMFARSAPEPVPRDHPLARRVTGISRTPVRVKLYPEDRVRHVIIGILPKDAGYAAILPSHDWKGEPTLYALRGKEMIAIAEGGSPVFPSFTRPEIKRISRDQAPPHTSTEMTSDMHRVRTADLPALPHSELPDALTYWTRYDRRAEYALTLLFDQLAAETRVYRVHGTDRAVRLLRDVKILVRGQEGSEEIGIPFDDGMRVCVIVSPKNRPPSIRPLTPADEICVPSLAESMNGQVIPNQL